MPPVDNRRTTCNGYRCQHGIKRPGFNVFNGNRKHVNVSSHCGPVIERGKLLSGQLTFQVLRGDQAESHHEGHLLETEQKKKTSSPRSKPDQKIRATCDGHLTLGSSSFFWEGHVGAGGASCDGGSAGAPGGPSGLLGACGWIIITWQQTNIK